MDFTSLLFERITRLMVILGPISLMLKQDLERTDGGRMVLLVFLTIINVYALVYLSGTGRILFLKNAFTVSLTTKVTMVRTWKKFTITSIRRRHIRIWSFCTSTLNADSPTRSWLLKMQLETVMSRSMNSLIPMRLMKIAIGMYLSRLVCLFATYSLILNKKKITHCDSMQKMKMIPKIFMFA